jgi:hypothetical protein
MSLRSLALLMAAMSVACRSPRTPPPVTKVAVVEFSVAPNARIERFDGDVASLGMPLADAAAAEIRDDNDDDKPFAAVALPKTVPPDADLIVRGEITHVYGGNGWVQATALLCTACGWWTGNPRIGFQGTVSRRDGSLVAVFSDETMGTVERAGKTVGAMVKEDDYHGGHPGNDGYLVQATPGSAVPPEQTGPADRLRALDNLRAQGLVSDAEYTEKRKQILRDF